MNYSVIWIRSAENDLAALWLDATSRIEVTQAAAALDRVLQTNAHDKGESRNGDERILFSAPLGITFTADPVSRQARVLHVWMYSRR